MADEKRFIIKRAEPLPRSPFVGVEVLADATLNLQTGAISILGRDVDADGNSEAAARARSFTLPPDVMDGVRAALVVAGQKIPEGEGGLPAGTVEAASVEAVGLVEAASEK